MRIIGTAVVFSFLSSDGGAAAFCGSLNCGRAVKQPSSFFDNNNGRRQDVVCHVSSMPNKESSSSSSMSEAERLLQMAKRLREQAAQAEQEIHESLTEKKAKQDSQTDDLIRQ